MEDMKQSNAAAKSEMEIIQLYEKEPTILDCDREKIFDETMDERLDQPLKQKKQWVNRWKQCILSSKRVAHKLVAGQQHLAKYYNLLKTKVTGRNINRY